MNEAEVLELLEKVGAFRAGHFVFTHGAHSDTYVLKDAMYAYPRETSAVCKAMAEHFADKHIEVVIGPAIGAAILSQWVAHHLTEMTGKEVFAVYADKDGQGGFVIKRGYDQVVKGKRVLIVEDLTTTGGSVKKVVKAIRDLGGEVAGVVVLGNRGDVTAEMVGNPPVFVSMVKIHLDSWDAAECDLCKKGIPINTDVGHGKQYLAQRQE